MLFDDGDHSIEKSTDMSKLRFYCIVVRSIFSQEAIVVLTVLLEIFGSLFLCQVGIALLTNPRH